MIPAMLEAARHELAQELWETPDAIDWVQLDDGRYVVRAEGYPVFVADVSSLDADARLGLDSDDDVLRELVHYSTGALRAQLAEVAGDLDGDVENGPRTPSADDVEYLAELHDELQRREDDAAPCGHGTQLDRDCSGELRCVECDGPCPGCHDGPEPDDVLRCVRCDRDELLYPDHPDATSENVVCLRCEVELDASGVPIG